MLEEKVVELNIVEKASDNPIGRTLKNALKPHRHRQWVIPPDANASFVAAVEDVLETYQKSPDPNRPLVSVWMKTSKQLIVETRAPITASPGRTARHDYEYERDGAANLFMMFAPLAGWRRVKREEARALLAVATLGTRAERCEIAIAGGPLAHNDDLTVAKSSLWALWR